MTIEKLVWLVLLSACALEPPPEPKPVDCSSDRAVERYPEDCDDGGTLEVLSDHQRGR